MAIEDGLAEAIQIRIHTGNNKGNIIAIKVWEKFPPIKCFGCDDLGQGKFHCRNKPKSADLAVSQNKQRECLGDIGLKHRDKPARDFEPFITGGKINLGSGLEKKIVV